MAGRGTIRGLSETRTATEAALAAVFREEAARLTAAMVRMVGNFDIAEEVVQDSLVAALEKWPDQGIPDNPGAWLMTTARRRAIDILRRDRRYAEKVALLSGRLADGLGLHHRLHLADPALKGFDVVGCRHLSDEGVEANLA